MSLDAYMASRPDRCPGCGYHVERQGCRCDGSAGKAAALAAVTATTPDTTRQRIDAAILRAAATGDEFSANDIRGDLLGVPGQQIGPRFGALAKQGRSSTSATGRRPRATRTGTTSRSGRAAA